ncbi:MAG: ParA family protein [Humibacillus sp.]|nr:ParA family protein [Humibacillus sp.]MDN5777148.1 ParA family protein [Humibacillus sp.]
MSLRTPERIAFVINKGGCGKTSCAANVGGEFANAGYKVLLVSLDMQDNLAEELGYAFSDEPGDDGLALAQSLMTGEPLEPALTQVRPNLDVVTGGVALRQASRHLGGDDADPTTLARALAHHTGYDFIIYDCPPGDLDVQRAALVATDWAVVPAQIDAKSRKGIQLLATQFQEAAVYNEDLGLLGVVLFDVPTAGTRLLAETRAFLSTELAGAAPVFNARIRTSKATARAANERGLLVAELANIGRPQWWKIRSGEAKDTQVPAVAAHVAQDYTDLTEEILRTITYHRTGQHIPEPAPTDPSTAGVSS